MLTCAGENIIADLVLRGKILRTAKETISYTSDSTKALDHHVALCGGWSNDVLIPPANSSIVVPPYKTNNI